jgi:type IV pilus assembly protein PilN
MIRINLLPYRAARKAENVQRQIFIFVSSLVLVTLALFYYNGTLSTKIQVLDENVKKTDLEIKKYQKIIKEIEEIKKQLEVLREKIAVINNLKKGRRNSVQLLDNMSRLVVANRMWFTDFEDIGPAIIIKGIALDNKTVSDFMTRLEGAYAGVRLKSLQQVIKKGINLKSFQINCTKGAPKKKTATGG